MIFRNMHELSAGAATFLSLTMLFNAAQAAEAPNEPDNQLSPLVSPPVCADNRDMKATYIATPSDVFQNMGGGVAAAVRNFKTGAPEILLDVNRLANTPWQYQKFAYYHECAHHELGHMDIPKLKMHFDRRVAVEMEADCRAVSMLRDREKFSANDMTITTQTTRFEMEKNPNNRESQIRLRENNIQSCFLSAP